jgi:hypothetical protein
MFQHVQERRPRYADNTHIKRALTGPLLTRGEAYVEISQPSEETEAQPFEELEAQPFEIIEVQTREYHRFNTRVTQWKVRLNPPPGTSLPDPVIHFADSVNNLFDRVLEDVSDG